MSLRDRLTEILPTLLPPREEEAIKGRELIERVRAVLGDAYSDRTLRSQFSMIALEEDSCLARVPNGQGYYLRRPGDHAALQSLFGSGAEAEREGRDTLHKALALAVRLYDTAGLGVFVFPPEDAENWEHADLVAVQWPAGHRESSGAYILDDTEAQPAYRAVCVSFGGSAEDTRRALYRALACGLQAEETELLLLAEAEDTDELTDLGTRFGVGVRVLGMTEKMLRDLPRADELFRMSREDALQLLGELPQLTLALPRRHTPATGGQPDLSVVREWAETCVRRGRVEAYEQRVAVN